jgi:hypothetical protein
VALPGLIIVWLTRHKIEALDQQRR